MSDSDWLLRLKAHIESRGISQAEISRRSKVSTSQVSSFFQGKKDTTVEKFLAICQAAGANPSYILTGVEVAHDAQDLLHSWQHLSPDEKKALLLLARSRLNGAPPQ